MTDEATAEGDGDAPVDVAMVLTWPTFTGRDEKPRTHHMTVVTKDDQIDAVMIAMRDTGGVWYKTPESRTFFMPWPPAAIEFRAPTAEDYEGAEAAAGLLLPEAT